PQKEFSSPQNALPEDARGEIFPCARWTAGRAGKTRAAKCIASEKREPWIRVLRWKDRWRTRRRSTRPPKRRQSHRWEFGFLSAPAGPRHVQCRARRRRKAPGQ